MYNGLNDTIAEILRVASVLFLVLALFGGIASSVLDHR